MKYCVKANMAKGIHYKDMVNFDNLKDALAEAKPYDEIYLLDDYYYGQFFIRTPYLRLIGNDNYPQIDYDAYHGLVVREEDGGDGVRTYGTTGSATLRILPEANNFYMEKVKVSNSYERKYGDKHTQNVAFKTEASNGRYYDVKFIGTQDTLYIDANNNTFKNCYIEGDVDFIFGKGDALIYDSVIKCLKILDSSAYILAPSTLSTNQYGLIIYNSKVLSAPGNKKYLGRAWYPGGVKEAVEPKSLFKQVSFADDITMDMITMHEGDPTNFKCYLKDCVKNDEIVSNYEDKDLDDLYQSYIYKAMF